MNITCNRKDGVIHGYAIYLTDTEIEVVRRALVRYLQTKSISVSDFQVAHTLKTAIFKAYTEEII